jgi:putative transposase
MRLSGYFQMLKTGNCGALIDKQNHRAVKRNTRPMLGFKAFRAATCVLAGIELIHMIRKGQMAMPGCEGLPFADQFYVLAGPVCPA